MTVVLPDDTIKHLLQASQHESTVSFFNPELNRQNGVFIRIPESLKTIQIYDLQGERQKTETFCASSPKIEFKKG